jgi:hypothetical protein
VLRGPWNFVPADAPDNLDPSRYPAAPEPASHRFSGLTRLKAKHRVLVGSNAYDPGAQFVVPAKTAEWLVSENHAEPL